MPVKKTEARLFIHDQHSGIKVKYKDVFDLKAFYEALHDWLQEYGWTGMKLEGGSSVKKDLDRWETYYGERKDQGGATEIWFQWRMMREVEHAAFLVYYLDMDFHCIGVKPTQIVREGVKWEVNKGEIEITIKPSIHKKYEDEFSRNWFLKEFQGMFTKRIYRRELQEREKELYQEAYALQNFIKQWFKLKRYLPYEETKNFAPSYAWPSHVKE